ncbi:EamA family transporter [Frigoriglobus tundricola]|uniref:Permease of the drug/metabolite transporter (DMT) superfamily n=1 Tax=Frigoriglobus tundricola TaxID=2774151 RepID=A0A6M5YJP5_9BACT|nr:EamA family transporter [Frigoriglobus tundricola]QJW93202.1 Permease of the drug/metabolite transporter (DMT) superfamily [Frigoriglobus tundricola]
MGSEPPSRIKLLLAFAAIYVLWGSTYLAIRLAIDTLPPFLMAGTRFLIAGSALYALSHRQAGPRPTGRHWRNATVAAVPLFVIGNGGVTWAEQAIPSGAAALVIATLPAWLLLLDWVYGGRTGPRWIEVLGIGSGLAGVAALSAPGGIDPVGAGVLLLAAVAWAIGSLFNRYAHLPASPVLTSGMQMLAGGVIMVAVGLALGEGGRLDPGGVSGRSIAAVMYLVAVAVVALPAYTWLLSVTSPALVGTYAFVNPVVAVLLGWAALGEAVTGRTALAAALVVSGVMLLVWPRRRTARRAEAPRAPETECVVVIGSAGGEGGGTGRD